MEKLLVVEGVQAVRNELKSGLAGEYAVLEGTDRADAMELFLKHFPKVVTLDLGLPPDPEGSSEGVRCLEWIIRIRPATKVVVLTPQGGRESAYRALECGAYDFHQKPIVPEELQVIIRRAFHLNSVEEQSCKLKEALERTTAGIQGIAGQCVALQRIFSLRQVLPPHGSQPAPEGIDTGSEPASSPWGATAAAACLLGQAELAQGGMAQVARVTLPAENLTLREARDRVEKWMVTDAIGNSGGNMTRASELLGVSRPALYDLMKKYGICCRRGNRG